MVWEVEFDKEASNELRKLDKTTQIKILKYLRERIATKEDPKRFGAPLAKGLSGLWKYRIGDYRLICKIEENKLVVLVVRIGHRKNVYDKKKQDRIRKINFSDIVRKAKNLTSIEKDNCIPLNE